MPYCTVNTQFVLPDFTKPLIHFVFFYLQSCIYLCSWILPCYHCLHITFLPVPDFDFDSDSHFNIVCLNLHLHLSLNCFMLCWAKTWTVEKHIMHNKYAVEWVYSAKSWWYIHSTFPSCCFFVCMNNWKWTAH